MVSLLVLAACMAAAQAACATTSDWHRLSSVRDTAVLKDELAACLAEGIDVNHRDVVGCSLLVNAMANNNGALAALLVAAGADAALKCRSGNTALTYAARYGDLATLQLLHSAGGEVDASTLAGSLERGHMAVARYLVGAHLAAQERWAGTELMWAAAHDQPDLLRAQLARGAQLEARDRHGLTALAWAAREGATAALTLLLERGADIEAATHAGQTPAILAALHGRTAALALLHERGANLAAADLAGWTVAHWAAVESNLEALHYCIAAGVSLKPGAALFGWSPLMAAAAMKQIEAVRMLLRNGSERHLFDVHGHSLEDLACLNAAAGDATCALFRSMRATVAHAQKQRTEL